MAGSLGRFQVFVGADISEFEKKIKQVQRGLDKMVGRDFARFAGQVRTAMMGLAGALGLVGVAAVTSAAQLEQQKVAFTTLLKSAQKADDFLRKLQSFAAATPFQFDELVDASKKMLAFGFAADDVLPTLRKVGDAAAGLGLGGDGIDRIVRALGQMQS
jgi:phage tail tape-measure protein